MLLLAQSNCTVKERLVLLIFQIFSFIGFQDLCILAKHLLYQRTCHIVGISVGSLYLYIFLLGIHTESQV